MSKKTYLIATLLSLTVLAGCKKLTDLNINDNPNAPTQAPLRLLLSSAQLNTPAAFEGINTTALGFVGILANQGSDAFNLDNNSYNGLWNAFYTGGMKDLDELLRATESGQSPHFRAVALTMKAYFTSQFVDLFGDVPYSQAFQGNSGEAVFAPKFDAAKDIYANLFVLLDSADANYARTSAIALQGDMFYGNSIPLWRKLNNTVRLQLLMKTRQVDASAPAKIGAIFASGNFISAASGSEDFQFKYNKSAAPEGRHPWFRASYLAGNDFTYFSKQFMLELLDNEDPRQTYYVRRQTGRVLNPADPTDRGTIPAFNGYIALDPGVYERLYTNKGKTATKQDSVFLAGFFGRVRGDQTGVPADGAQRAVPGSYPAGGLCDFPYATPAASVRPLLGGTGSGNGVLPLITANMVQWWQLEYMLSYNVAGARTLFDRAMRQSFAYVQRHGKESDPMCPDLTGAAVDTYVNSWLARFDAANSDDNRLDVVLKQAWFSNMANGLEIYTTFRRTALPRSIDAPATRARQFALRLPYPSRELNLNSNAAPQNSIVFDRDAIFWDVKKFRF